MKARFERRHSRWYERFLLGWSFQIIFGLPFVVLIPSLERWGWEFWLYFPDIRRNTVIAIMLSFMAIAFTLRRIMRFPGVRVLSYIFPTVSIIFLIFVAILFFTREAYTRQVLFGGYLLCLVWFFTGYFVGRRYRFLKLGVVPCGEALSLNGSKQVDFRYLNKPEFLNVRFDAVVADLRAADLSPEWEKFLAKCTLFHIPVYHVKQVKESLTGRVKIDHLSENAFGTLLPSPLYATVKRLIDIVGAVVLIPFLAPLMLVFAVLIKVDSKGPAFFVQERMGYRGVTFNVYKFRSMRCDLMGKSFTDGTDDPRITKIGKYLRKYRIDELPQIFNVLKGEMSFIGPRPESMELSEWYEREVPFFSYRHVVRPGISGWAQVTQGYAAEIEGMTDKLQYDFYYIKHFSLWIDVLIFFKTVKTVFTGFGAR